jgi:excisionase family DNA binding protein
MNTQPIIVITPSELQGMITKSVQDAMAYLEDKIFTHEEAAKYLRIAESTLHAMKREGKVKYYMVEKSPRYRKSDLDNVMKPQQ